VPNLLAVYGSVRISDFMMPFLFGAGLGVAQVLFGLAALCVGMALSFATTIGLGAALGTLVPILLRHPAVLKTARGEILVLGVLLMVAGVIVCSWAGRRREREQRSEAAEVGERSYMIGIVMAAAAGLLAPMLNHSLAFGDVYLLEALATTPRGPMLPMPYGQSPLPEGRFRTSRTLAGSCTAIKAGAISFPYGHRS
jgi:L-rhamnose-H+ transport protein